MTARKCTPCFMLCNEMDTHALNSIALPRVGFVHGVNRSEEHTRYIAFGQDTWIQFNRVV